MKILGFDSSAKAGSVALTESGRVLAQYSRNDGLTHSVTLLPMAKSLLQHGNIQLSDVDAVAVSIGPGSFTGIRIGISTVKGLCWGSGKPAIGVSTLEAMAYSGLGQPDDTVICCAMDARRSQIYNALFEISDGMPHRITVDAAISLSDVSENLKKFTGKRIFVVGDGAVLCYNYLLENGIVATLAPESVRLQSAVGVCLAAEGHFPEEASALLPNYLRLSQAERERQARIANSDK